MLDFISHAADFIVVGAFVFVFISEIKKNNKPSGHNNSNDTLH